MRRFALAGLIALLTLSVSGASVLVVDEPCTTGEQPGQEEGRCPPTCVTCGCCAQPAEPSILYLATTRDVPAPPAAASVPRPPQTPSRDIFHVPKLRVA